MIEISYLYSHSYDYFLDPKNQDLNDCIRIVSNNLFQVNSNEILNLPREIQKLIIAEFLNQTEIDDFNQLLPYLNTYVFKEILKLTKINNLEKFKINSQKLKEFIFLNAVVFDSVNQILSINCAYFHHDQLKELFDSLSLEYKKKIRHLNLIDSPLINLLSFSDFIQLITLNLDGSNDLVSLDGIKYCQQLERLSISRCRNLMNLKQLEDVKSSLQDLQANENSKIENVQVISKLKNLKSLSLNYCFLIKNFKFLSSLINLEELSLRGLKNLNNVDFILNFTKLKKLDISYTSVNHVAVNVLKPDLMIDMEGCIIEVDEEEAS